MVCIRFDESEEEVIAEALRAHEYNFIRLDIPDYDKPISSFLQ